MTKQKITSIEKKRRERISERMKELDSSLIAKNRIMKRKKEWGYINSPETRKKLSESWKQKWKYGEATDKQRQTLFKKGFDSKRNTKQIFKEGHEVPESWRNAVKENRKTQVFPLQDSLIEVKIQNFLKELNIEFFTHQYMNQIEHSYQCDIFIPSMNMILECDGDYWHKYPIGKEIDMIRRQELIAKGFNVISLWESQIKEMNLNNFECILNGGRR